MTSKQLRRGHNFGIVYFTKNTLEEEIKLATSDLKRATGKRNTLLEKKKKLESEIIPPILGREHISIMTDPVRTIIHPKPKTLEKKIETEDYIDRPVTPLFFPQERGEHKHTQVEDGDLFHFDREVEPILEMLTTKILEQSRMEVIEEDEIAKMKQKQRSFEEIRNRELMEVQKLEKEEIRRKEEISRRMNQQKEMILNTKTIQKKLYCRVFAKDYLSKMKYTVLTNVIKGGILRKVELVQFSMNLHPLLLNNSQALVESDAIFDRKLSYLFDSEIRNKNIDFHRKSIQYEIERREKIEFNKIQEKEKRKELRRKIKEEKARLLREQEKQILKQEVLEAILNQAELVEDTPNVFDPLGSGQFGIKHATLLGGFIGQWAFIFTILSQYNDGENQIINKEIIWKLLEGFIIKMPNIVFAYNESDFESIKRIDPANILTPEDILKVDEDKLVNIL